MANVISLDDFRTQPPIPDDLEGPMSLEDQAKFATDTVADQWAGELSHSLMMNFAEGGTDIDFNDPIYGKLMEAMNEIVLSMTRLHLNVFDTTAAMLDKYPDGEISVGVLTPFVDDDDLELVKDDSDD